MADPNPLAEAAASSLDELMSRQPPYSDDDLRRMVEAMRKQRELWAKAEAAGAKRAPKAKATPADLSGDDLGL